MRGRDGCCLKLTELLGNGPESCMYFCIEVRVERNCLVSREHIVCECKNAGPFPETSTGNVSATMCVL